MSSFFHTPGFGDTPVDAVNILKLIADWQTLVRALHQYQSHNSYKSHKKVVGTFNLHEIRMCAAYGWEG
jgi:hypothetical protein